VNATVLVAVASTRGYRGIPAFLFVARGEYPALWAALKVLNPRPIPFKNNIPRCSAAGLLILLRGSTAKEFL
jgi:hypothetical protein